MSSVSKVSDAMLAFDGGEKVSGQRESVYSAPKIKKKPETWLERQRREAAELKMRIIAAQTK